MSWSINTRSWLKHLSMIWSLWSSKIRNWNCKSIPCKRRHSKACMMPLYKSKSRKRTRNCYNDWNNSKSRYFQNKVLSYDQINSELVSKCAGQWLEQHQFKTKIVSWGSSIAIRNSKKNRQFAIERAFFVAKGKGPLGSPFAKLRKPGSREKNVTLLVVWFGSWNWLVCYQKKIK